MEKTTLLIMAAGLGSRFGGEKQIEPIGPNGEFLIHYSIYDALKAGFNKIVFVIKEENYKIFKEKIGKLIEDKVEVHYVYQKNELDNIEISKERKKPLGTGHCIYSAKEAINEEFGVINADDFYGFESFKKLYEALNREDSNFYSIGFPLKKTLSKYGSVKRGVCEIKNNLLININECKIEIIDNKIKGCLLHGEKEFEFNGDEIVSMSMYGLNPTIFKYMENDIYNYFKDKTNDLNLEYFLPEVVSDMIKKNLVQVEVIKTHEKWFGLTNPEDLKEAKIKIEKLINEGKYTKKLF